MTAEALKYSPDQPREPAGSPEGGRFASDGESGPPSDATPKESADWLRLQSVMAPGATVVLDGHPDMARRTAAEIARLGRLFPATAGRLATLSDRPRDAYVRSEMERSLGAAAATKAASGTMYLNPGLMADPALTKRLIERDAGWNPPGYKGWESTLDHEFGHVIAYWNTDAKRVQTELWLDHHIGGGYGQLGGPAENFADYVASALSPSPPSEEQLPGITAVKDLLDTISRREVDDRSGFWDRFATQPLGKQAGSPLTFASNVGTLFQQAAAEAYRAGIVDAYAENTAEDDPGLLDPDELSEDRMLSDFPDWDPDEEADAIGDAPGSGGLDRLAAGMMGGSVSDSMLTAILGSFVSGLYGLYNVGFGDGVYGQGDVVSATWVAVGDKDTCEPCAEKDGQTWEGNEPHDYPGMGRFGSDNCRGGPRCRCEIDYQLIPGEDPGSLGLLAGTDLAKLSDAGLIALRARLTRGEWVAKYREDQARDDRGRFADEGRGGALSTNEIRDRAADALPGVLNAVDRANALTGGDKAGRRFVLKGADSIERKIAGDTARKGAALASRQIYDALRLTTVFKPEDYVDGVHDHLAALRQQGYVAERVKNQWVEGEIIYSGVNAVLRDPNGYLFEVQYHTPVSLTVKQSLHDDYAAIDVGRTPDLTGEERAAAYERMVRAWSAVPVPFGIDSVESFDHLKAR